MILDFIVRINNGTITYTNNTGTFSLNGGVSATGNISAGGNLSVTGTGSITGNLSTSGTMSINGCTLSYNPTSQKLSIADNTHVGGNVDVNGKFIINGANSNAEISYAGGDSDPVIINKKLETKGVVATGSGSLSLRTTSGDYGFSYDGYGIKANARLGVPNGFRNDNNSIYVAELPNMDSWTANKTLATTDELGVRNSKIYGTTVSATGTYSLDSGKKFSDWKLYLFVFEVTQPSSGYTSMTLNSETFTYSASRIFNANEADNTLNRYVTFNYIDDTHFAIQNSLNMQLKEIWGYK